MDLKVVYRYYAGENMKGRPSYYSKDLALASLLRAVETGPPAEVIFLIDGQVESRVRKVMEQYGSVQFIKGGNSPRAFCKAIVLPRKRYWADDSLVLFCEDDYLWTPDLLTRLVQGAESEPDVDYFAPYSLDPDWITPPTSPTPVWLPIKATTMTFAGRTAALKEDERFMRLCVKSGAFFDTALFHALRGKQYFGWSELAHDAIAGKTPKEHLVRVARSGVRVAVNLARPRKPERRRVMVGCWPHTATHLEAEFLAEGSDWTSLAAWTKNWITERDLPLALQPPA